MTYRWSRILCMCLTIVDIAVTNLCSFFIIDFSVTPFISATVATSSWLPPPYQSYSRTQSHVSFQHPSSYLSISPKQSYQNPSSYLSISPKYISPTSTKLPLHLTKTYIPNIHQFTSPYHQNISLQHPSSYLSISPKHISPTSIKLPLHFNRTYLSKIHQITSPSHQNISLQHPSNYLSISPKHISPSYIK